MNETGQLSIDFLIGFTIFMVGLIMVASMVPGLLIGLRRTTAIDYDAVAYRTGAILAEDSGWSFNNASNWEINDNKNETVRLGLAVYSKDKNTANTLSLIKIKRMNDSELNWNTNDYQDRIFFGGYPYRFNISLRTKDNPNEPLLSLGDSRPEFSEYGYIRRVVKIKNETTIQMNLSDYPDRYNASCYNCSVTQTFTLQFNMNELVNEGMNPIYRFDPQIEPIYINISNFSAKFNWTKINDDGFFNAEFPAAATKELWNQTWGYYPNNQTFNATLATINFCDYKGNGKTCPGYTKEMGIILNITNTTNLTDTEQFIIENIDESGNVVKLNDDNGIPIFPDDRVILNILPGTFDITSDSDFRIEFVFNDTPPRTLISGMHTVNYTMEGIEVNLQDGWLDVAVW